MNKHQTDEITAIFKRLEQMQQKPEIFASGDAIFWQHPHIAKQLLQMHLDPNIEAASRNPDLIQRTTDWILKMAGLSRGDTVLDLGCGPGLYAECFAKEGYNVIGLDFSQNSIRYAEEHALKSGLAIDYRCENYLEFKGENCCDLALLIYGDLCPLSPSQREKLFSNVRRALKPGGLFIFDVTTPALRLREGLRESWSVHQGGFWRPGWHILFEKGFAYDGDIYLDQYIVLDEDSNITLYRNWFQDFTPETIRAEVSTHGFMVESLWGDLIGSPLTSDSDWIGVITRPQ